MTKILLLVKGWNCETPKKDNPSLGRLKPECILNAFAKKVNLVNVINSCFFKPLHFLLDCQKHQRLPLQQFCHKDRKKLYQYNLAMVYCVHINFCPPCIVILRWARSTLPLDICRLHDLLFVFCYKMRLQINWTRWVVFLQIGTNIGQGSWKPCGKWFSENLHTSLIPGITNNFPSAISIHGIWKDNVGFWQCVSSSVWNTVQASTNWHKY